MTTATYSEINTANLVEIHWDFFCVASNNTCDWFHYKRIFHVIDDERLADLTARHTTELRHSVAKLIPCYNYPETLMFNSITYITTGLLIPLYLDFMADRYTNYAEGHIRVREIKIIH
jgi:hypothetical protein